MTTLDRDEHLSDAIKSGAGGFLLRMSPRKGWAGVRLVAGAVVIGVATGKSPVAEISRKLQLRDRIQAVVFTYENGLVIRGE